MNHQRSSSDGREHRIPRGYPPCVGGCFGHHVSRQIGPLLFPHVVGCCAAATFMYCVISDVPRAPLTTVIYIYQGSASVSPRGMHTKRVHFQPINRKSIFLSFIFIFLASSAASRSFLSQIKRILYIMYIFFFFFLYFSSLFYFKYPLGNRTPSSTNEHSIAAPYTCSPPRPPSPLHPTSPTESVERPARSSREFPKPF